MKPFPAICAEPLLSNHNVALVSVLLWLPGNVTSGCHGAAPPRGRQLAMGTAVVRGSPESGAEESRRSTEEEEEGRHVIHDSRSKYGERRFKIHHRRNVLS